MWTFDLSIGSTETKYIKLNTKTQNIFCDINENLTTFYTPWQGGQDNRRRKKVKYIQNLNIILKNWVLVFSFWVLVFSFMYLVSVGPMDRSIVIKVKLDFFYNLMDFFRSCHLYCDQVSKHTV